jgi:hypothetical protein
MQTLTRYEVEELWADTVGVQSVPIDWADCHGEEYDGWESFAAPDCPTCGDYAVRGDVGSLEAWTCPDETCEQHGQEIDPYEDDGGRPVMNYHYPLPDTTLRVGDEYAAAEAIRDLPLCLVRFGDGSLSLALTGGGMDLSWEIAEAFTRLGYLPPLHFCDLPRMSGYPRDDAHRYTIAACLRSCDVAEAQAARTREHLQRFEEEA